MAQLPLNPNLGFYKKLAKQLKRAHSTGEERAAERIARYHPKLKGEPPGAILGGEFSLADAQLVIAREQGFESWARFKEAVRQAAQNPKLTNAARLMVCIQTTDDDGVRELLAANSRLLQECASRDLCPLEEACDRGLVEIARLLLDAGADPSDGRALLRAAHAGPHKRGPAMDVIDLLLERGVPDDLFKRAALGELEAVRESISGMEASQLDAKGPHGCTAAHLAASNAHLETLRLLLEAGADPNVECNGKRAWDEARLHFWNEDHRRVAVLLLDHGATCSFHEACILGHLGAVEHLLKTHPELLDEPGKDGITPLGIAVLYANVDLARRLLEAGASDPDGRGKALVEGECVQYKEYIGTVFRNCGFSTANFNDVDFGNTTFRNVNFEGTRIDYVNFRHVKLLSGVIDGFTIYGIDVSKLIEAELERRAVQRK